MGFQVLAGNCLAMAQGIVGAPIMYESATDAANATKFRHHTRELPNSICVLWFSHEGAYGQPGAEVWKDWGHVCIYVPGVGILSSSPIAGQVSGPWTYQTLEDMERTFAGSCRFWTEDINGLRVCEPEAATSSATGRRKQAKMLMTFFKDAAGKGKGRWAIHGPNFWLELSTQDAADAYAAQLGVKARVETSQVGWDKLKKASHA